jgi:hypothetical protein
MKIANNKGGGIWLSGSSAAVRAGLGSGITLISESTPLARLNYYDGQFLRAEHLNREQRYLRRLTELSNQADGAGVAHGFHLNRAGESLQISDGLAIDFEGRVLLLPETRALEISDLIARSRQSFTAPQTSRDSGAFSDCVSVTVDETGGTVSGVSLYLITIAHAESLCGQEDVYGALCESACVSSTAKPYWLEGVVVRARPLVLSVPLPVSSTVALTRLHLRSRVASAYFEQERRVVAHLISRSGLASNIWCRGAESEGGIDVPIGVMARAGSETIYLEAWTARRERIQTPAHRYWQWRMAMRPMDVFLAQVLQFQCQLRDRLAEGGAEEDPCADTRRTLSETEEAFSQLTQFYADVADRLVRDESFSSLNSVRYLQQKGYAPLQAASLKLAAIKELAPLAQSNRQLIDRGIIELPSAGYLPVAPGDRMSVNEQVRRWMGEGVDLRFCVVRHDFVPHAWEEAQHMERISLLEGLDDPNRKPRVDILVPDGEMVARPPAQSGQAFRARFGGNESGFAIDGAARFEKGATGLRFYTSMGGTPADNVFRRAAEYVSFANDAQRYMSSSRLANSIGTNQPGDYQWAGDRLGNAVWASLETDRDPLALGANEQTSVRVRIALLSAGRELHDIETFGTFRVLRITSGNSFPGRVVEGVLNATHRHEVKTGSSTSQGDVLPRETSLRFSEATLAGEYNLMAQLGDPKNVQLALVMQSSGDPLTVKGSIQFQIPTSEPRPVPAEMTADPNVLTPGNTNNTLARSSLQILEAALNEQGFAAASARLLFDTPSVAGGETSILATRDWVLFHRRREKDCGLDRPQPAPLPQRRYQVVHLGLPSQLRERLQQVREWLAAGAPELARLNFQLAGQVIFEGGAATLVTEEAAVRADWQRLAPGPEIVYAAIGSRGAAEDEGPALASSRLTSTVSALDPISRPAAGVIFDDLPNAPLASGGVDGSIIVITVAQAATEINRVYGFSNADLFTLATEMARRGEWTNIEGQQMGIRLGDVRFTQGDADPQTADLSTVNSRWRAENLGQPIAGVAIVADTDETLARDRSFKIADPLGSVPSSFRVVKGLSNVEAGVVTVLLLLGRPDRPSPVPQPPPVREPLERRVARLVFVPRGSLQEGAIANVRDLLPDQPSLIAFRSDQTLEAGLPQFPSELRGRVRRIAVVTPNNDGGTERRAKALVGGLVQQGLIAQGPAGGFLFDLEQLSYDPALARYLTGGATELMFVEIV